MRRAAKARWRVALYASIGSTRALNRPVLKAVNKTADENDLSHAEKMFLKKKLESEIRVKLAEFANEISQARKLRDGK